MEGECVFRDPGLDPKDLLFILLFQPISTVSTG